MESTQENARRLDQLKTINREQEGRLHNLQTIAFQLANCYFVIQGVILTAICNRVTPLRCSDRWFLFTLSLVATTLDLVFLIIIGCNYLRTKDQQDYNWCECNELERKLINPAASINLPPITRCHDPWMKLKRFLWFAGCMSLFLVFAAITLYGCWHFVCRNEFKGRLENDKCIRLCQGARCISICSEFF